MHISVSELHKSKAFLFYFFIIFSRHQYLNYELIINKNMDNKIKNYYYFINFGLALVRIVLKINRY